jgi:penicillin-binding protein 2
MIEGIKHSCDVYFYDLARKVGIDAIATMARKLGLGHVDGIDLPGERAGTIPDTNWKQATIGESWYPGETLVAGIGQGFITTTPLQLAVMTARLANGGFAVEPRVVRAVLEGGGQAAEPAPSLGLSPHALRVVLQGMEAVVNGKRGTARKAALEGEIRMAGKTGTAQVRRITKAERAQGGKLADDTPWEERDHALFVAYAPAEAPRYAVSLVVEHGGSGTVAAMIAKEIVAEVLRRDPLGRAPIVRLASRRAPGRTG